MYAYVNVHVFLSPLPKSLIHQLLTPATNCLPAYILDVRVRHLSWTIMASLCDGTSTLTGPYYWPLMELSVHVPCRHCDKRVRSYPPAAGSFHSGVSLGHYYMWRYNADY